MQKNEVTRLGFYRYARPDWKHLRTVEVVMENEDSPALSVLFQKGKYSVPMHVVPGDSMFFYLDTEMEEN